MTRRAHETAIDKADDLGSERIHRLLYPGLLLPSRQAPASESFISQRSIRVLVIEDDPYDIDYLQELLADVENASFDFACADRLTTGLAYLAEEDFDVILLDLFLPDSRGLDTFLKARQQNPGVPIVVLTCLDDEGLALQAVQAGAQDYLTKGHLDGIVLTRAIRYAIERHRLLCALSHQVQELAQANAALVRSNQELTDLSYIAAHDLQDIRGGQQPSTRLMAMPARNSINATRRAAPTIRT